MVWSIRYRPNVPLEFASPLGAFSPAELSRTCVVPIVDAHMNTRRPRISRRSRVFASITATPVARLPSAFVVTFSTIASVKTSSRPVAFAAGNVELCVLK